MLSRNTTKKSSGRGSYFASIKESGPVPLRLGTPLLPICLEQEYHTGEKLNAIFNLLQQSRQIAVLVSGSLYRHTIQITESLTPKEAFEKARRLGQEWEEEYESIINETSRKTDIAVYKWEILLLDEKYPLIRKQLEKNYLDKPEFKQAFDHEANLFIERLLKKNV